MLSRTNRLGYPSGIARSPAGRPTAARSRGSGSWASPHGFRTIVLAFVPGTDDPRKERGLRVAAELGFPVVDVGKAQAAYMRSHGIAEYAGSALTVSAADLHPSPLSHELAAEALLEAMAEQGLVAPPDPSSLDPSRP